VDAASIISLITVAVVAIFTSITAPLIIIRRTERMHRQDMLSDYQRQDKVAREAKAASDAALAQQASSDAAAAFRDDAASDKLDVIHGLVNSTLSAALQSEMDALLTSLAMMREVIDLKRTAGHEPTAEAVISLRDTEARIADLRSTLAERQRQAAAVISQMAAAAPTRVPGRLLVERGVNADGEHDGRDDQREQLHPRVGGCDAGLLDSERVTVVGGRLNR
jgi:hypothetical protein